MSVNEAIETQLNLLGKAKDILMKDSNMVYANIIERSLEYGSTYYWSQDFVRLLESQANMLPEDAVLNFTDFLSEAGFIWFEKSVTMPEDPSLAERFTAWADAYMKGVDIDVELKDAHDIIANMNIELENYHRPDGSIDIDVIRAIRDNKKRNDHLRIVDRHTGEVLNTEVSMNKMSELLDKGKDRLDTIRYKLEKYDAELQIWHSQMEIRPLKAISWVMLNETDVPIVVFTFWSEDKVLNPSVGMYPEFVFIWYFKSNLSDMIEMGSKSEDDPTRITQALKYACASVLFMTQKVFSHSDERPNRAVRHRISTWRPDPIVKVIRLRRAQQHTNSNPEHDSPEHAFQWMVTGHWRNQWYSASNTHRTIWIAPFIKGPPDKPLKEPRARIYAVVR